MKVLTINLKYYWVIYRVSGSILEVGPGADDLETATQQGSARIGVLRAVYKEIFPDGIY